MGSASPSKGELILAIDPGERVGWAVGAVHSDILTVTGQGVNPLRDFAIKLVQSAHKYDTIVYETWRLYPHMAKTMVGNDFQPAQLVGMIRLATWLEPSVRLVSQGASIKNTAIRTMPDVIQERMEHSSEQHDKDALMHLSYYWWRRYVADAQEVV